MGKFLKNATVFFFFNDPATTEIYPLSLPDALPISPQRPHRLHHAVIRTHHLIVVGEVVGAVRRDRKSTRLNSSHLVISYAVFCLKKKKMTSLPTLFKLYKAFQS